MSYLHQSNGQGMGIPKECTRFECLPSLISGGVFAPKLVQQKIGNSYQWICPCCNYSYGSEPLIPTPPALSQEERT